MTTLADMPQENPDPVHLLLIADSKLGKSTYVAQAAKAGFHVLYVDSDNGLSALRFALRDDLEAQRRVTYVRTDSPATFLEKLFDTAEVFRWDLSRDSDYVQMLVKPESRILEISVPKLLQSSGLILSIDSWTTVAGDSLGIGADKAKVALTDMGGESQRVYGDAYRRATFIAACIQQAPFHVIVQAHGTIFERYSKPLHKSARDAKQAEFILEEVMEVPLSTSKPHGKEMGKFFNHIAWLGFDSTTAIPRIMIDFTRRPNRLGGGPPNVIRPIDEFGFEKYAQMAEPVEGYARVILGTEMVTKPALAAAGHQGPLNLATTGNGTVLPATTKAAAPKNPLANLAIFQQPAPDAKPKES